MAAAEALISTIARAFYDDDVVCLIDVLIREKYLRDDDMVRMFVQFIIESIVTYYYEEIYLKSMNLFYWPLVCYSVADFV